MTSSWKSEIDRMIARVPGCPDCVHGLHDHWVSIPIVDLGTNRPYQDPTGWEGHVKDYLLSGRDSDLDAALGCPLPDPAVQERVIWQPPKVMPARVPRRIPSRVAQAARLGVLFAVLIGAVWVLVGWVAAVIFPFVFAYLLACQSLARRDRP